MSVDATGRLSAAMDPQPNRLAAAAQWVRANGVHVTLEVLFNFVLPFAAYRLAKPHLGDVGALMVSSPAPMLWTIVGFVRHRRVDALSVIVLTGIGLSLVAFAGGGGVKFLQLREQLVAALIGMIFLGSVAVRRPLIYFLARARLRRRAATEQAAILETLRDGPIFRRAMTVATLAWGVGLVAEASIACTLVFVLTIPQFLVVNPILGTSFTLALTAWTYWYVTRRVTAAYRSLEPPPAD